MSKTPLVCLAIAAYFRIHEGPQNAAAIPRYRRHYCQQTASSCTASPCRTDAAARFEPTRWTAPPGNLRRDPQSRRTSRAKNPDLILTINRSDLEQTMMGVKTLEARIADGTAKVQ